MRVVLVGSFYPPYVGGIESHMASLARGLQAKGAEVRVVCLQHERESAHRVTDGDDVRRLSSVVRLLGERTRSLSNVDVVHFHGFSRPLFLCTLLATTRRAKIVLTPHGSFSYLDERRTSARAVKAIFDRTCGPLLRGRVSGFIALTESEKRDIQARYRVDAARVLLIPSPLPTLPAGQPDPTAPSDGKRFLTLTRLASRKNLADVIRALECDPSLPGCDIVGPDDGAEAELRALAARLPPGRVSFHGPLEGDVKVHKLRGALALVLPSSWEMLSMAALEAMSVGTPVVASQAAASGLPSDAVVTYPTGSIPGLVAALRNAAGHRGQLSENARRAAATWPSSDEWVRMTLRAYEAVVAP